MIVPYGIRRIQHLQQAGRKSVSVLRFSKSQQVNGAGKHAKGCWIERKDQDHDDYGIHSRILGAPSTKGVIVSQSSGDLTG